MTATEKVFFSVIIAAYNVEHEIAACLTSICKAHCPQTEIIVVLGASKDRTNEICADYEKQGLVKCVMQDGKGLSNARNCGIRHASGLYLTFADADDWVVTERFAAFVQCLRRAAEKRQFRAPFDVLANDYLVGDNRGNVLFVNSQIQTIRKNRKQERKLTKDLISEFAGSKGTFWNAWRYVYRTDYLMEQGRAFWEGHTCEDLEFAVKTLLDTRRVILVHMPYYCYCPVRPYSLMHRKDLVMIRDFWMAERNLLQICGCDPSLAAREIEEKLKKLLIWNLPDIWEVGRRERRGALKGYETLVKEIGLPEQGWEKYAGRLCRWGGIGVVSGILYCAKWIRRAYRYHEKIMMCRSME